MPVPQGNITTTQAWKGEAPAEPVQEVVPVVEEVEEVTDDLQ